MHHRISISSLLFNNINQLPRNTDIGNLTLRQFHQIIKYYQLVESKLDLSMIFLDLNISWTISRSKSGGVADFIVSFSIACNTIISHDRLKDISLAEGEKIAGEYYDRQRNSLPVIKKFSELSLKEAWLISQLFDRDNFVKEALHTNVTTLNNLLNKLKLEDNFLTYATFSGMDENTLDKKFQTELLVGEITRGTYPYRNATAVCVSGFETKSGIKSIMKLSHNSLPL